MEQSNFVNIWSSFKIMTSKMKKSCISLGLFPLTCFTWCKYSIDTPLWSRGHAHKLRISIDITKKNSNSIHSAICPQTTVARFTRYVLTVAHKLCRLINKKRIGGTTFFLKQFPILTPVTSLRLSTTFCNERNIQFPAVLLLWCINLFVLRCEAKNELDLRFLARQFVVVDRR